MPKPTEAVFFVAISCAYLVACCVWLVARRLLNEEKWPSESLPETTHPWLDLCMVLVGAGGVFAVGEFYRRGWLLPSFPGPWRPVSTALNLSIPYTPLFLIVLLRRQSFGSVMLSRRAIGVKVGVGVVGALAGLGMYLMIVGGLDRFGGVLAGCCSVSAVRHAPAVFLEGVAVAFVFDRLRWFIGNRWAVLIPGLLFAAGHVPRSIAEGRSAVEIAMWFAFNTALPAGILLVVSKSRDVIWIAIPHYVLDVAIGAFGSG